MKDRKKSPKENKISLKIAELKTAEKTVINNSLKILQIFIKAQG
jgi:hypothetical protein